MIVGSAREAGCALLHAEDMQSGQNIRDQVQVVITNPFLNEAFPFTLSPKNPQKTPTLRPLSQTKYRL